MSHEVETMAFANATPWHSLGNRVDPSVSIEEMLKAAGLDWEVKLHPVFAYVDGEAIELSRQALIRSTDKKVLTVTGDDWHPVQNRDTLEFFRDYTQEGGATLETAGSLRGGKVIWGLANLGNSFTVNGTDVTKGYLLLTSHHEVGFATSLRTTSVRVVCANTLAMAERDIGGRVHKQNHTKAFDQVKAKDAIGLARYQFEQAGRDAEKLTKLKLSEFDATKFLASFFQPLPEPKDKAKFSGQDEFIAQALQPTNKDRGIGVFSHHDEFITKMLADTSLQSKQLAGVIHSMNNAPGAAPGTAWGVLNGVTHWCDHVAGREADARLFNSWLGERGRTKIAINRALVEMAS